MLCLNDDSHDCFDIHVAYITDREFVVITMNMYKQYRLRRS